MQLECRSTTTTKSRRNVRSSYCCGLCSDLFHASWKWRESILLFYHFLCLRSTVVLTQSHVPFSHRQLTDVAQPNQFNFWIRQQKKLTRNRSQMEIIIIKSHRCEVMSRGCWAKRQWNWWPKALIQNVCGPKHNKSRLIRIRMIAIEHDKQHSGKFQINVVIIPN